MGVLPHVRRVRIRGHTRYGHTHDAKDKKMPIDIPMCIALFAGAVDVSIDQVIGTLQMVLQRAMQQRIAIPRPQ